MARFSGEFEKPSISQTALFKLRSETKIVDIRKNPVLWDDEHIPIQEIDSFVELLTDPVHSEELLANAVIDLKDRYDFLWEEISSRFDSDVLSQREVKTCQLLAAYNFGTRFANQILIQLTHSETDDPQEFGNWAREGLRNQSLPHADSHIRQVESLQAMNVILGGADVYDPSLTLVVAGAMKPIFHDIMQNLWEQQKILNPLNEDIKKLDPKDDHKEAAAFLIHVLKPMIKKTGHLSDRLTEELCRVLAAGISVHDQLDDFQDRLSAKGKVRPDGLTDEQLYTKYTKGELDQLELTGRHRYIILRQRQAIAAAKRMYNVSVYGEMGMGKSFEDAFKYLIEQAITSKNSTSIDLTHIDREQLIAWDSLFNLADIWEMIIPGEYGVLRKEKVFRSTLRKFISPARDIEIAFSPVPLENYDESSWCRAMYEYRSNVEVLKKSPFSKNPLFMEFMGNTILYNMMQSQKLYRALIKGEAGFAALTRIRSERMLMLAKKALTKAGATDTDVIMTMSSLQKASYDDMLPILRSKLLQTNYGNTGLEYAARVKVKHEALKSEFQQIMDNIRKKPRGDGKPPDGKAYTCSQKERQQMEVNFTIAWDKICTALGITDEQRKQNMKSDMETFLPHRIALAYPILPNPGYPDSLGRLSDARTLTTLPFDIQAKFQKKIIDFEYE